MVLKGGFIATAAMGDPNASIPTPQPVRYRPMFGSFGEAVGSTSITFLSRAALENGVPARLGLRKMAVAVKGCRGLGKSAMVHNDYCPRMEVDPETYEVRADGQIMTCEAARVLPMAQRYFCFDARRGAAAWVVRMSWAGAFIVGSRAVPALLAGFRSSRFAYRS